MVKQHFEIILGTYEEFIVGYKLTSKSEDAAQSFAVHSHAASVRCLTNCGTLLSSGGTDDRIMVYDLRTRKEHCLLNHHAGTVNCLHFTNDRTHLISGGQDGLLAIARVGSWQIERTWPKAHQGAAVLDIAVHPSGKFALTLGADATLRTWNLIKGRLAYVINLNSKSKDARNLQGIQWAPDGVRFILIGSKNTDVWSIETGGVLKAIEHQSKVTSCIWHSQDEDKLIVGYDDGNLAIVNINTGALSSVHKVHAMRVKCIAMFRKLTITASSDGEVKVWSGKMKQLCVINAGCRITSMCVIPEDQTEVANDSKQEIVDETAQKTESPQTAPSKRKQANNVVTEMKNKRKSANVSDVRLL